MSNAWDQDDLIYMGKVVLRRRVRCCTWRTFCILSAACADFRRAVLPELASGRTR